MFDKTYALFTKGLINESKVIYQYKIRIFY